MQCNCSGLHASSKYALHTLTDIVLEPSRIHLVLVLPVISSRLTPRGYVAVSPFVRVDAILLLNVSQLVPDKLAPISGVEQPPPRDSVPKENLLLQGHSVRFDDLAEHFAPTGGRADSRVTVTSRIAAAHSLPFSVRHGRQFRACAFTAAANAVANAAFDTGLQAAACLTLSQMPRDSFGKDDKSALAAEVVLRSENCAQYAAVTRSVTKRKMKSLDEVILLWASTSDAENWYLVGMQ